MHRQGGEKFGAVTAMYCSVVHCTCNEKFRIGIVKFGRV